MSFDPEPRLDYDYQLDLIFKCEQSALEPYLFVGPMT